MSLAPPSSGSKSKHHRTTSGTFLSSITNPIATIFTSPKVATHALFLNEDYEDDEDDDGERKLGESSTAAAKRGNIKRVELKVGGMTVSCARHPS
jgi:hypothetical protein